MCPTPTFLSFYIHTATYLVGQAILWLPIFWLAATITREILRNAKQSATKKSEDVRIDCSQSKLPVRPSKESIQAGVKLAAVIAIIAASLALLVQRSSAQSSGPQEAGIPVSAAQGITFPLMIGAPAAPAGTASVAGAPGANVYFYWIVGTYTVGKSKPYGPLAVLNAPTLSASNYVTISPQYPPGVQSVDVLRTTTATIPAGACSCAVATAVTSGNVNDQGASLGAYTMATLDVNTVQLSLTNEPISTGVTHLILRQNGVQVADLNTVGTAGITCSGTCSSPTMPIFSSGSQVTNGTITHNGTIPGGQNSGLTVFLDSTLEFGNDNSNGYGQILNFGTNGAFLQLGSQILQLGSNIANTAITVRIADNGTDGWMVMPETSFANLPSAGIGSFLYCTNCTSGSTPCTGSGSGAWAFQTNGTWKCPF